jgi:hypothetical protein
MKLTSCREMYEQSKTVASGELPESMGEYFESVTLVEERLSLPTQVCPVAEITEVPTTLITI